MGVHILVLAGGSGTRLWPLSRQKIPKHLLPLATSGATLLRATVERVAPIANDVSVVTSRDQLEDCLHAIEGIAVGDNPIIAEPMARGTGPALALAVAHIRRRDPKAVICSVHADHHIGDDSAYRDAVVAAAGWASATGGFVAVGLTPQSPSTAFGYIEVGNARETTLLDDAVTAVPELAKRDGARKLTASVGNSFVEKPDLETAHTYVESGHHLWNTGIFAWTAEAFWTDLLRFGDGMAEILEKVVDAQLAGNDDEAKELYGTITSIPIEPLLFERTKILTAVAASFPWSDVGSWPDLLAARQEAGEGDADGNVVSGAGWTIGAKDSYVVATPDRPIVLIGTSHVAVIDTGDVLMVADLEYAQRVKEVQEILRAAGREDLL